MHRIVPVEWRQGNEKDATSSRPVLPLMLGLGSKSWCLVNPVQCERTRPVFRGCRCSVAPLVPLDGISRLAMATADSVDGLATNGSFLRFPISYRVGTLVVLPSSTTSVRSLNISLARKRKGAPLATTQQQPVVCETPRLSHANPNWTACSRGHSCGMRSAVTSVGSRRVLSIFPPQP
ncbi:hypothetical protein N656DRAFT_510318 [Canariomyces notabilis]|uniref:Uncharacterized protein n=1 Tax=Canariomyces notabilis TaxID=2074819 RepID=A0AAN6T7U2_9PEZI|nr:hypothetical protein N656DRAFT_510318 [Canariomyces arenarius]